MSPVRTYQLVSGLWSPTDGVGGSIAPAGTVIPPEPEPDTDWRARSLMLPDPGKVVFGFSPTVGTLGDLETLWGRQSKIVRVYGGTLENLNGIMGTCQNHLNGGRVPVLDYNTSAQFSNCGWRANNVNGANMWQRQAEGFFDNDGVGPNGRAYKGFDSQLLAIKALTKGNCPTNRIMLSKDHEMEDANEGGGDGKVYGSNNKLSSGTPAQFRAAWQHMRQRADALGVTNILWFMDGAARTGGWGDNMTDTGSDVFYPGHAYIDFVAWDPYNSAGLPTRDTKWRFFNDSPGFGGNGILNKFGQMDWWRRNFRVDGLPTLAAANAAGHNRVYKPAMLAEFGTVDSFTNSSGTFNSADGWAQGMINWLNGSENQGIFKWLIYFNNVNMTILNQGSYRRAEFNGKGTNPIWQ